jgi:hypothetical protein
VEAGQTVYLGVCDLHSGTDVAGSIGSAPKAGWPHRNLRRQRRIRARMVAAIAFDQHLGSEARTRLRDTTIMSL